MAEIELKSISKVNTTASNTTDMTNTLQKSISEIYSTVFAEGLRDCL